MVLEPFAWHAGGAAVLLACRTSAGVGWTTPDAHAAASGLIRGAADASSRLGSRDPRGGGPLVGCPRAVVA